MYIALISLVSALAVALIGLVVALVQLRGARQAALIAGEATKTAAEVTAEVLDDQNIRSELWRLVVAAREERDGYKQERDLLAQDVQSLKKVLGEYDLNRKIDEVQGAQFRKQAREQFEKYKAKQDAKIESFTYENQNLKAKVATFEARFEALDGERIALLREIRRLKGSGPHVPPRV